MSEDETTYKVEMELEIPASVLGDTLVTAFDGSYGGCWYWCGPGTKEGDKFDIRGEGTDAVWHSVDITLDEENDDGVKDQHYRVDYETLKRGMQLILTDPGYAESSARAHVEQAILDDDAGEIDAGLADTIVQLGLFGKEIYG